jgi:actin, other eukaryote
MCEDAAALVVDNGSGHIKAGFGGDYTPHCIFPTLVGCPRSGAGGVGWASGHGREKGLYVGDEAWSKRSVLALRAPVERGVVTSWDDMEEVWRHTFENELRASPAEHPVRG